MFFIDTRYKVIVHNINKISLSSDLSEGVLGFDCEWVNEGPVSLLQLATFNGVCALFRIGKIGYIPDKLKVQLMVSQNRYNHQSGKLMVIVIKNLLINVSFFV